MDPIAVVGVEFYTKDNAKLHHTEEYDLINGEMPTPILRRGENFFVALRFDRPFDAELDVIRLSFGFGKKQYYP